MKVSSGKSIFAVLAVVALIGLTSFQAQALQFSDDRGSFFSNDFVDWETFGPGIDIEFVPSGSSTASNNLGVVVNVANPVADDFLRLDFSFVNLNFGGKDLLYTSLNGVGPLEITFDRPIFAAGAQIAANNNVLPFLARIEAFNAVGTSLGFFEQPGDNFDVLAPVNFMGVFDPLMSIRSVQFSLKLEGVTPADFFINQLDFLVSPTCPPCPPVPLPGSLLLVGSILLGAVGLRRLNS